MKVYTIRDIAEMAYGSPQFDVRIHFPLDAADLFTVFLQRIDRIRDLRADRVALRHVLAFSPCIDIRTDIAASALPVAEITQYDRAGLDPCGLEHIVGPLCRGAGRHDKRICELQ